MASCISYQVVLLIVILSYNYASSSLINNCNNFPCPDGRFPGYPFSQVGNDSSGYCGYPDFVIKCSDTGRSVLSIAHSSYYVENSDINRLIVVDVDIWKSQCPRPVKSFISNASQPFYMSGNSYIHILYNCSRYSQDVLHIACLDFNPTKRSYAFHDVGNVLDKEWQKYCEEYVVLPALKEVQSRLYLTDSNYTSTLKEGFQLFWDTPSMCFACEESGGACWVNETTNDVSCLCGEELASKTWQAYFHQQIFMCSSDLFQSKNCPQCGREDSTCSDQVFCPGLLPFYLEDIDF